MRVADDPDDADVYDPYEHDEPMDTEEGSNSILPYSGALAPYGASWGSLWTPPAETEDEYAEYDDAHDASAAEEDDSLWAEALISVVLIAGVVLFLFPEPLTSTLGVILLAFGLVAWLADALS